MIPIFAITTRGLEAISMTELAALPGVTAASAVYRRVHASFTGDLRSLLSLRTVDDVFLHVDTWTPLTHTRAALNEFIDRAAALDLTPVVDLLRPLRSLTAPMRYSLTVNFVGKRNYSVPEIRQALEQGIAERYSTWQYAEDDAEAALNIRLFIEHETAVVGVRAGERPLHRRGYKQSHLPGSLKPPVAAAMLMLAGFAPGSVILDPFCGSGTLPIEARLLGLNAMGGDSSMTALEHAQHNLRDAGLSGDGSSGWFLADAAHLPLADGHLDGVVSNLPWDRQIPTAVASLYEAAGRELKRVTKAEGRIVLLMPDAYQPALQADHLGWELLSQTEISLFGQTPSILVFRSTKGA